MDIILQMLLFGQKVLSDSLPSHELQHAKLPCVSLSPRVCSNSSPLSQWCHPTILSSIAPFSSCTKSFQVSKSSNELARHIMWPRYWSFSISLPMNILGWFPLGLTCLITLQFKDCQESSPAPQFEIFHILPSYWSSSQNHTWLMEKPLCSFVGKAMSLLF